MKNLEEAKDRTEFRLTYAKTAPREFSRDMLLGPKIPDAYGDGLSVGDWGAGDWPEDDVPVEQWLAHFMHMAVNEAIHEALEYFKVDGEPYLDPHGPAERAIYRATDALCRTLAALRTQQLKSPHETETGRGET
jgi:hypothetical protein